MADSIISIGNKIELTQLFERMTVKDYDERRVYVSQVFDIQDDIIQCAMPIYEGHLIPLELGTKYETYFYTDKSIYKANAEVVGRKKEENIYTVEIRLISKLQKFQRREFFRLDCNMNIVLTAFTDDEFVTYRQTGTLPKKLNEQAEQGVIIDISGGGVRIISKNSYEKNSYVALKFTLDMESVNKDIYILGRIITSVRNDNRLDLYDQRIKFIDLKKEMTDMIVKYIFEQQRKSRNKERG